MNSPFPGMDPYLEPHWLDVHTKLVAYSADALNAVLPDELIARTEERVGIESGDDSREVSPDVRIFEGVEVAPFKELPDTAGVALAPYRLTALAEPITERFIEIIDSTGDRLISVIEFISPTNKRGPGLEAFVAKREELLSGRVNVVEIDLVRAGDWRRLLRPHGCIAEAVATYRAVIRVHWSAFAWIQPMSLRQPLPAIRIPLRQGEAPIELSLQPLIQQAYQNGRYSRTLKYDEPLDPPLGKEDDQWMDQLLRAARRRN